MRHFRVAELCVLVAAWFQGDILDAAETARERPPLFALCHDMQDARQRTPAQQAEMLAALGFDGVAHLWFSGVEERLKTIDRQGLRLFQIYERVNLAASPAYDKERFAEVLPLLKGRDIQIALLLTGGRASDPSLDDRAAAILREMADKAAGYGVSLVVYPHRANWAETVDDGIRVAKKVDRKNVGTMFNLCHWAIVDQEEDLQALLTRAMPHLLCVTINGSDSPAAVKTPEGKWIVPLDEGDYDVRRVVQLLQSLGYRGAIGLQCYGIQGDAQTHLQRSMRVWRSWHEKQNPPMQAAER
ncbi:MAG: TIM barrel protein [Pirellulales bacterium]|nr:TIM barrel protein [Pirellulales bacterium]